MFQNTKNPDDYRSFFLLRAKNKYIFKQCYRSIIRTTESFFNSNPFKFSKFVRKNRSSQYIPKMINLNGVASVNINGVASHFLNISIQNIITFFRLPVCSTMFLVIFSLICLRPHGLFGIFYTLCVPRFVFLFGFFFVKALTLVSTLRYLTSALKRQFLNRITYLM